MKMVLKRTTALFVSICMMLSMFGTMFAVNATGSVNEAKKYVSLGDSMTNGYGLPGYDGDMGCYDYGHASYANQLAAYYGFDHSPLAMSAMRVEDLHWLLEFDYTDEEAVAITDADYNDGRWEEYGEAAWNAKFPTTGDYWTWNELCDDYRFAYAAAYIKAAQGDETIIAELAKNARYKIKEKEAVIVAETYQNAIKEADVVSFGMGNGNFGVFMLNRIMEAIGFIGTPDDAMIYKIDRAIAACPASMQAEIKALIPELYKAIENKLGVAIDDGDDNNTTILESIAHTAVYTCLSFVINYRGCIDAILTLNEKDNVDIILLNLLNTYKDPADDTTEGVSIGDLLEALYGPMNAYIAALPTVMQASGNPLYENATFYYAAPEDISCMVNVYGYDFYENGYVALENRGNGGVACTTSVTRDRFVTDIVGGGNGIVWRLLGGLGVVPVTLEEICAYDAMTYAQKTAYAAVNADKAKSCAIYLAFEAAIIEKASATAVLIESIMSLGNLDGSLFNGVMGSLEGNIYNVIGSDQMIAVGAATGLANVANAGIAGAGLGLTGTVTFEDILSIYNATDKDAAAKAVAEKVANAEANSTAVNYMATQVPGYVEAAHAQFVQGVKAQIVEQLYGSLKTAAENMTTICTLLATPLALSNSIKGDSTVISLMALFGRCNLGHGLGGHPSPAGHNTMFAAVLEAYEGGHTAADETLDNMGVALDWLIEYAKQYYPEITLPITDIIESEEFIELRKQIEAIYEQYQAANPEQQVALSTRIYSLLLRLNTIVAMTTSKKLENVNYYVSLGDSTLTGYGLDEYVPGMNNGEGQVLGVEAPILLAQKLFGEGYESHFKKLDKGGIRIEDLLVWLGEDEFIDDFYVRYTMDDNAVVKNTEYYQNLFISEIEKADLITLAVGGGNVTNFVARQVDALESGEPLYEMDWSKFYPDTDMTDLRKLINSMQNVLAGSLPEIDGVPVDVLASVVAESFLFGLVGFKENYTKVLDRIHEINPDAHVVIVGYFNPIDNMVIPFTFGSETTYIPLGSMFGLFQEICNEVGLLYALQNKENTTFTAISDATTILDELGLYDLESQINGMIKQTWLTHAGPKGHEYIANQIYTSITTDYASGEMVLPPVDYKITAKSSYVALGDNKQYTEAFANYLKACVDAEGFKYEYKTNTDLIIENSSINTLAGIVAENIDAIATADLISIGYSLDKVAENTMRIVLELLIEGQTEVPTTFDWVELVGEDMAETLTEALAGIHATLIEQGLGVPMSEMVGGGMITFPDVSIADAAMKAIEYFAYHAVEYAVYMPEAVQLISAINPNATIMVNTLSNPMAGAKMSMMGMELEFGDYLDYLTDLIFYESALITVMNEKVVLVPANRVETTFTNYVISLNPGTSLFKDFMALTKLIAGLKAGDLIKTTANGNAYVLAKMMSALNISVEPPIRGDFNSDGSVTVADSVYLMVSLVNPEKYSLNQSGDLNGDGKVDRADTTYLTRFLVSPAEYPLN